MRTIVAFGLVMGVLMAVGVVTAEALHDHPVKDLFQRPVEPARDARPVEALREISMPTAALRTPAGEV